MWTTDINAAAQREKSGEKELLSAPFLPVPLAPSPPPKKEVPEAASNTVVASGSPLYSWGFWWRERTSLFEVWSNFRHSDLAPYFFWRFTVYLHHVKKWRMLAAKLRLRPKNRNLSQRLFLRMGFLQSLGGEKRTGSGGDPIGCTEFMTAPPPAWCDG